MSWRSTDRKKQEDGEWTGFLEQGVRFEGTLEASGTLRIDSFAKGTLISQETLILGEHAVVEGQIIGHHVIIEGRFTGTIQAQGHVQIRPKAIVSGQIETPCLLIEPGSVFDGDCHMPAEKEAKAITIPVRTVVAATGTAD